jgi:hypothetical protein
MASFSVVFLPSYMRMFIAHVQNTQTEAVEVWLSRHYSVHIRRKESLGNSTA